MQFTFPDSGKTIEFEPISYTTLSMLRAHYEVNYKGKPVEPKNPLDTIEDGNVQSEAFKLAQEQYVKDLEQYKSDLEKWSLAMGNAQWAATKVLYAKHLKELGEPELKEVSKVIAEMAELFDISLPAAILAGYEELGVKMPEQVIDRYIYLFHVCITNNSEQSLFTDAVYVGSAPTQEAVREAIFRLRR